MPYKYSRSMTKLFDTVTTFLKEFVEKVDLENCSRRQKIMKKFLACKEIISCYSGLCIDINELILGIIRDNLMQIKMQIGLCIESIQK